MSGARGCDCDRFFRNGAGDGLVAAVFLVAGATEALRRERERALRRRGVVARVLLFFSPDDSLLFALRPRERDRPRALSDDAP